MGAAPCAVDGCDRPAASRGWCAPHYQRWYRLGDVLADQPLLVRRPRDTQPRTRSWLWSRCEPDHASGCWNWTGFRNHYGYGIARDLDRKRPVGAHRLAYELFVGPIPDGLVIDHLCRNRACVNPAHMETVTPDENTARGLSFGAVNANKTHCDHGHEFTPENTYIRPNGSRRCRTCSRRWKRKQQAA